MTDGVDPSELEARVKEMYRKVAEHPDGEFHFELGRPMAERLGYSAAELDRIPEESIRSFAGVGHFFHLAGLAAGESVIDLGSGSGMDSFLAALQVGPSWRVVGIDMTTEQVAKSRALAAARNLAHVRFERGYIEATGEPDGTFDCLISNGVINLATDKSRVFREAARVLKRGGRFAISDIVTEEPLPPKVVCSATLWAA